MPSQLFAPDIVVLLKQKMAAADAVGFSYFKNSACHKYNVRQVPLKPDPRSVSDPVLAAVLRDSRDGMRNFFPLGMMPDNIGSNRGLLLVLKDLYGIQPRPGHSFLSADCNIFLRLLKVFFFSDLCLLILMEQCLCV